MKEFIEKLIGRLGEQQAEAENEMHRLRSGDYTLPCSYDITDIKEIASESFKESIQIVNELAEEYKDSEEQGLLLRLPCKIGDVFFSTITNGSADKCKVSSITIKSDETFKIRLSSGYYRSVFEVTTDDIGKTIFLTKEEAEQTLKQMGE